MKVRQDQLSGLYTCPMHPEVQQDNPGKCPKCGMDLVPKARPHGGDHPRHVQGKPGQESGAMADHAEMVRQMRAPWLWTNFTIIAMGAWLITCPFTFGYRNLDLITDGVARATAERSPSA